MDDLRDFKCFKKHLVISLNRSTFPKICMSLITTKTNDLEPYCGYTFKLLLEDISVCTMHCNFCNVYLLIHVITVFCYVINLQICFLPCDPLYEIKFLEYCCMSNSL